MISIEKNDVDISKLFNWGKKVEIETQEGSIELYLRIVSDEELNIARTKALRASAELRKKLRDSNTEEHLAYIPDISRKKKAEIIEMILALKSKELSESAVRDIKIVLPVEPKSTASTEELEKYQEAVDQFPMKRLEQITKEITKRINKERSKLSKLLKDELTSIYTEYLINSLCEAELNITFLDYLIFFGLFKDSTYTSRAFEDFKEFNKLPKFIKLKLREELTSLQIPTGELKK